MGNYSEQHDPRISGADFEDANDDDDDDFQVIRLVARLKAQIADLEDAAEALVHWCKKRDQWWDETVILNDVLQKKLLTMTRMTRDPQATSAMTVGRGRGRENKK